MTNKVSQVLIVPLMFAIVITNGRVVQKTVSNVPLGSIVQEWMTSKMRDCTKTKFAIAFIRKKLTELELRL